MNTHASPFLTGEQDTPQRMDEPEVDFRRLGAVVERVVVNQRLCSLVVVVPLHVVGWLTLAVLGWIWLRLIVPVMDMSCGKP